MALWQIYDNCPKCYYSLVVDDEDLQDNEEDLEDIAKEDPKMNLTMALEFIGIWGYDGRRAAPAKFDSTLTLYKYLGQRFGQFQNQEDAEEEVDPQANLMSSYVSTFLNVAKDIANDPDMKLPQSARKIGIKPAHVTELLNRLNFYGSDMVSNPSPSTQTINQASVFTHLVPVMHLLRLFYGYDPIDILTKPM